MQKSLVTALATLTTLTGTAYADVTPSDTSESNTNSGWFATVDKTLEEQPHWVCPVVTVFPQLVEEFRYDEIVQNKVGGTTLTNNGGGVRGLELIPSEHVEILIGQPGYMNLQTPKTTISGWTDETLLMKYRFLAANEEHGNYIVSGFMGVSLPTGNTPFTQNATVTTPTLAVGKGWGTRSQGVAIMSTFSESFASGNQNYLGEPTVWNTAFQGHFSNYFWPEIETSVTHWKGGPLSGKDQLIVTYGINFGRITLEGRNKLTLGIAYQTANMSGFSTFGSGWIATSRLLF
ncbi:MAG: hypothetical protein GJU77_07795 [Ferrovum sp.]|jgi:hypothetical protein|nr:hypothetical protein [Ferrovum sp.]NDU90867.1 hypothetical protein [Ferrovum sp.]